MLLALAEEYLPIIQWFTPIFGAVAAAIALISVRENIRIHKRNKRADAIFHCNARYDDLYKFKISIRELPKAQQDNAVESYYFRYWGLKSDEFDYWLADLIDADTFSNWSFLTLKAFKKNHPIVTKNDTSKFEYGWDDMGKDANDVTNPWFTEYVGQLVRLAALKIEDRETEHKILVDLLQAIEDESSSFRRDLRAGLSFDDYRKTRRESSELGLAKVMQQSIQTHAPRLPIEADYHI